MSEEEEKEPWWAQLQPTQFQQRLVIGSAVAAVVTFCLTIVILCLMLIFSAGTN